VTVQAHAGDRQQVVTGVMAEGVIDVLEAVEVDHEDRHRDPWAPAAGQGVLQPVGEQGPVGQAGQRIVQSLADELFLQLLALGVVAGDHRHAGDGTSVVPDR
jgi:hypothetical protein